MQILKRCDSFVNDCTIILFFSLFLRAFFLSSHAVLVAKTYVCSITVAVPATVASSDSSEVADHHQLENSSNIIFAICLIYFL